MRLITCSDAKGDAEASKAQHIAKSEVAANAVAVTVKKSEESHGGFGSANIKSIVFGGLDGIITTFSTIASVAGGNLSIPVVITLGFANLIADGIVSRCGIASALSISLELWRWLTMEISFTLSDTLARRWASAMVFRPKRSKILRSWNASVKRGNLVRDRASIIILLNLSVHDLLTRSLHLDIVWYCPQSPQLLISQR